MIIRRRPIVAEMHSMGPGFAGNDWTGVPAPGGPAVRQANPRDRVPVAFLFPGSVP